MKKWLIVLGIFASSIMFFLAGSFVGYVEGQRPICPENPPLQKELRKPKITSENPVFGATLSNFKNNLISRASSKTMAMRGRIPKLQIR